MAPHPYSAIKESLCGGRNLCVGICWGVNEGTPRVGGSVCGTPAGQDTFMVCLSLRLSMQGL